MEPIMKNRRTDWKTRFLIYLSLPFGLMYFMTGLAHGDETAAALGMLILWMAAFMGLRDKCLMFGHRWDGHTCGNYPAPKCRVCGEWHWRKKG